MNFEAGFNEVGNYYEVLNISPSASPTEVRAAYLRAKSAYDRDSVALYSLIDSNERDATIRRIEEAYEVLSHEERRRQYDANHGIIENTGTIDSSSASASLFSSSPTSASSNVFSIDRVPPMETLGADDNLLVAPTTDSVEVAESANADLHVPSEMEKEILSELEWRGTFLGRIRDMRRISLEEMSNATKIGKTYIVAIEQENFAKLPALVFLRGFLIQICRVLKLPSEKVLEAYLPRFKAAKSAEK